MSNDKQNNDAGYEVGYRKPPKSGQFQRGRSGNPKGRPKKKLGFPAALERELDRPITTQENGRQKTMTIREALAKQLVVKALKGEHRAAQLVISLTQALPEADQADPLSTEADERLKQELLDELKNLTGGSHAD